MKFDWYISACGIEDVTGVLDGAFSFGFYLEGLVLWCRDSM